MTTAVTVVIVSLAVGMVLVAIAAIVAILWMRNREQKRDEVLQSAEALATLDEALDDALKELNKVANLVQKEIGEKYQAMLFLYNLLEEKQKTQVVIPEKIAADIARAEVEVTAAEVVPLRATSKPVDAPRKKTPPTPPHESVTLQREREASEVISAPTVVDLPELDPPIFEEPEAETTNTFVEETIKEDAKENKAVEKEVYVLPTDEPSPVIPIKKKKVPEKKETTTVVSDGLLDGVATNKNSTSSEVSAKPAPRKRAANPKHQRVRELHDEGLSVADIAKELGIGKGEITLILEMAGKR